MKLYPALLSAVLLLLPAFASAACWDRCANGSKSTASCVKSCGIQRDADANACYSYCTGPRKGSRSTCGSLCRAGGGSSEDGNGISEADSEALDRASGRSKLEDCARRRCSQDEIDDAYEQSQRGSGSNNRDGSYYEEDESGMSQADRDALDRARADSARQEAEDAERRRRNEENN